MPCAAISSFLLFLCRRNYVQKWQMISLSECFLISHDVQKLSIILFSIRWFNYLIKLKLGLFKNWWNWTDVQYMSGLKWYLAWLCISTVHHHVCQMAPLPLGRCCQIIPLQLKFCRWTKVPIMSRHQTMDLWYWVSMLAKTPARSNASTTIRFSHNTEFHSQVDGPRMLYRIIFTCAVKTLVMSKR